MKTLLLARPDHSTYLYDSLRVNSTLEISYRTFGVFKKGSLFNQWKPTVKSVDCEVDISYGFTVFHKLLYILQRHISFDYYKKESQISEYFYQKFLKKTIHKIDIIHYWPIYCHKAVQKYQIAKPSTKTLADVYAVHPDYARTLLEPEYEKVGLDINSSHFIKSKNRDLLSLECAQNLIVPSEYLAQIYRNYFPEKNIFTANYGLLNLPQRGSINQEIRGNLKPLKIVFLGKVSIEKGCFYLLEALKHLTISEFHLDIIGDIEYSQISLFRNYFHLSNIRFLGKLPNVSILNLLSQYHIFVMPSLTDAYSLATAEALSSKIPVIVTENVGIKEDILKFNVGRVCKVQSVNAIIDAILSFRDEEFRQFLKSNIDTFIHDEKTNNYSTRVLNIYETLLSLN